MATRHGNPWPRNAFVTTLPHLVELEMWSNAIRAFIPAATYNGINHTMSLAPTRSSRAFILFFPPESGCKY